MKRLLSVCLTMVSLVLLPLPALASEVLDIAHRGYAGKNQESTLEAFRWAIAQGADGLELDIRQSADKVLLVTHEPVIPEIGNQRVENTQSKQAFFRSNIPSLEEVIILAKQSRTPLWIEIKQSHLYPGIIPRLMQLLQQYQYLNNVVIQSFNHLDLLEVYRRHPQVPLLALFTNDFDMSQLPAFVELVGLPLSPLYDNEALISAIHQAGKGVIFWRDNPAMENSVALQQFIAIGADGFMLDRPLEEVMSAIH